MYDGFISYSHSADDLLAPRLQAGLQRFAKPWWKRRAVRMFRDESSLAANPHLWSSIVEALDSSEWFVLLLSPEAAESEWVGKEIEHWTTHKDSDRILPVVTDGEFGWNESDVTGSSVPPALHGVFAEEPRWVDLRFAKGEESLDLKNPDFSAAVADIASAIRGVPKDELASEEVRQHRRTVRTAWAAGAALLVLAVAAVGFGIRADLQADIARSRELAAASVAVLDEDPELALLLALQAARRGGLEPEGVQALRAAVAEHKTIHTLQWTHPRDFATFAAVSPPGDLVAISGLMHHLEVWDIGGREPDLLWTLEMGEGWSTGIFAFGADGEALLVQPSWNIRGLPEFPAEPPDPTLVMSTIIYDSRTGDELRRFGTPDIGCQAFSAPIGSFLFTLGAPLAPDPDLFSYQLCEEDQWVRVQVDPETGQQIGDIVDTSEGAAHTDNGWIYELTEEGLVYGNLHTGESNVFADFDALTPLSTLMSPSGKYLIGTREVFDAATQELAFTYMPSNFEARGRTEHPCGYMAFNGDETVAYVHCDDGTIHIYETASGRKIDSLHGHEAWPYTASSDALGTILATGAPDGTRIWDLTRGRGVTTYPVSEGYHSDASLDIVGSKAVVLTYPDEHSSPIDNIDSTLLDPSPGVAVVFDPDTGEPISRIEDVGGKATRLSPSGDRVAVQAHGGAVGVYDTNSGQLLRAMEKVCQDEEGALVGCNEGQAIVFAATDIAWSPDGELVAAAGGHSQRLIVWDTASGRVAHVTDPLGRFRPLSALQFSPSGDLVVTSSKTGMWVFDTADWSEVTMIPHGGSPSWAMEFTPDGSQLVTAQAHHGQLRIFDTSSWEATDIATGSGQTRDIDLSGDGRLVALSNNAGFVHIVDLAVGEVIDSYPLPGADVTNVAFVNGTSHLLISDSFGPLEVLTLDVNELLDLARSRVSRTVSNDECLLYRIDPCPTLDELREG